ncbi:MAG: hypothetical protein Fur0011_5140 [Candidatus Microgenomates bacterium]
MGIVSGELIGIPEDSETRYCADFFRVPENMTMEQYLKWCSEPVVVGSMKIKKGEFNYLPMPIKRSKRIAYIVDATDPKIQPLLKYDAYGPQSHERMESIVNVLPRDIDTSPSRTTSAILVGIPSNFINGVLVSDSVTDEEVGEVKSIMGEKVLVYRTNGQVV